MSDVESAFQDLRNEPIDEEVVKKSFDNFVPRSGTYKITVTHKKLSEAGEKSPWPGRVMIDCRIQLFNEDGDKKGSFWASMSPVKVKNQKGQLDGASRLWGKFVAATSGQKLTVGEVFDTLDLFSYGGQISSSFRTDKGWYTPKNDEEYRELKATDFMNKAFLNNVWAAKE